MKSYFNIKLLSPILIVGILAGAYCFTMAPGLTWANHGSDGGDLISAAYTGGVAHPTGYPVYLVLAAITQQVPVGSLALRTNVLSAIFMILAALLVYKIVNDTILTHTVDKHGVTGGVAALTFGLTPIIWSQAVITEVYGLHAFLVASLIYLCIRSTSNEGWIGFVLGLAVGNHVTSLLLLPGIFLLLVPLKFRQKNLFMNRYSIFSHAISRILWGMAVAAGVVLASYLTLTLRALHSSPVIWGNPTSLEGLTWLISGGMYRGNFIMGPISYIWKQLMELLSIIFAQFGLIGTALSLISFYKLFQVGNLSRISIWMAFSFSIFVIFYNVVDAYVYLIPVIIAISIWIGLGFHEIIRIVSIQRSGWLKGLIGCILLLVGVNRVITSWDQVDASQDMRAERFGEEVMSTLPEQSIVFTNGDRTTFALRYFHFALGRRPDIYLIANGLLSYDWYRDNLQRAYPELVVPQDNGEIWTIAFEQENPGHSICHVYYDDTETALYCKYPDTPNN